MDPFAAALDAQFNAPGSAAAVYLPLEGEPVPIRVIRSRPTEETPVSGMLVLADSNIVLIRRSEVAEPQQRAYISIGATIVDDVVTDGILFEVLAEAKLDVEGLTWTCEIARADDDPTQD